MTFSSQQATFSTMQSPEHVDGELDAETAKLWDYYHQIRANDPKDALIQSLIHQNSQLRYQLHTNYGNDSLRQSLEASRRELDELKSHMAQNPFVMLLLNGNDMVFHGELIRQGQLGGKEAANHLYDNTMKHLQNVMPDMQSDTRLICRIYADVGTLAETLVGIGSLDDPTTFEDFVLGFTSGYNLFDFVDIGNEAIKAEEKIEELVSLHRKSAQCQRIMLGISQDNDFTRLLEVAAGDTTGNEKLILVEGLPLNEVILAFDLPTVRFGNLFQSEKLNVPPANLRSITPMSGSALTRSTTSMSSAEPAAAPGTKSSASPASLTWASRAALPAPPMSELPATLARTPQIPQPASDSGRRTSIDDGISRNRKGQRIDPPVIEFDKDEVNRIKKMKLCNVRYLLARCFRDNCEHEHGFKPSKRELEVLKLVARMTPCSSGPACDDKGCIYGHRCPFPTRTEKATKWVKGDKGENGGKTCIFGVTCKFPAEIHVIDNAVYKPKRK